MATSVPELIASLELSTERADTASEQLYNVSNGPASGVGSTVPTDSGPVPTLNKWFADNQAAINAQALLLARLQNTSSANDGAGIPAFNPTLNYVKGTIGYAERLRAHILNFAGVVGDGTTPTAAAIQTALNLFSTVSGGKGGVVDFEGGNYLLESRITVPQWVLIRGAPWVPDPSNGAQNLATSLIIAWGAGQNEHAIEMSHSSGISGFVIWYRDQVPKTSATPIEFGFAISTPTAGGAKDNILVENITLYNAYRGIRLVQAGRFRVRNVQGDPLFLGIFADLCLDACSMENVHFWNFYTQSDGVLGNWVRTNGKGLDLWRIDQLFGSKLFVWDRLTGIHIRDNFWGNLTDILVDRAANPFIVEQAAQLTVTGFVLIGNGTGRPAIWGRSITESAKFCNGRVTDTTTVGAQIDDGAQYLFDNVDFDCMHACVVNRSLTSEVRISDTCRWNFPPMGTFNTWIGDERLPKQDVEIALPAGTLGGAMTTVSGGYRAPLSTTTNSLVDWYMSGVGQRAGLHILEFDLAQNGTFTTSYYFQFRVSLDTGAGVILDYAAAAPLIINTDVAGKVRIPFHMNVAPYRTIARFQIAPTAAVPGASLDITNVKLYEQDSKFLTSSQVSMMLRRGYCLDPHGAGQTVLPRGKSKTIISDPIIGVDGRSSLVPSVGSWVQGDTLRAYNPVANSVLEVTCTGGGTYGTAGPPVFKTTASVPA